MISVSSSLPLRFSALVILLLIVGGVINLCLLGCMDAVKEFGHRLRHRIRKSHPSGEEQQHRRAA